MRLLLLVTSILLPLGAAAATAEKPTRFWNLTSKTIKTFVLAPAGSETFGPNQCANDKDGEVDHDERLKITNISSGRYDAKLGYEDGRVCSVKNIAIEAGKVFSIEDKDLVSCTK